MHEMIPILREVQELTLDLKQRSEQLSAIPLKEMEIKRLMTARNDELLTRQQSIKDRQLEKRKLEKDIVALEEKKKDLIKQQVYVRTNEEYAALNKQIKREGEKLDVLENTLLELFELEETEQADLITFEKEIEELLEKDKHQLNMFEEEKEAMARTQSEIRERVENLRKTVPSELLRTYDRIAGAKEDLVIVPILRNSCEGCFSVIPPQRIVELKSGEPYIFCEACGRMLILEKKLDNPSG